MNAAPSVWIASGEDAEAVAALLEELRDWRGQPDPSPSSSLSERVKVLLDSDHTSFLLARSDEWAEPFGVCQIRFRPSVWSAGDDAHIEDLYVRAHARGRGAGRALVEAAIDRAEGQSCSRIYVDVDEGNKWAIALYERVGFRSKASSGRQLMLRYAPPDEDDR